MRRALIVLTLMTTAAHAGPKEDLDAARTAFRQKDCASAKPRLKDLIYPDDRLASADELFEVRAMLGTCFVEEGNRESAKAEFERALQLRPRESLDPLFYSDAARRLFDDTRADMENRAKKDDELRKLQQEREKLEAKRKSLRVYREYPYAVNFAPFGFGQLQNGQTLKFALFGGAQIVTLGTSAGIWYYLVNKYGIRSDKVPVDDGPSVRRLQQIEIAAGVAFLGLYAWSVIDALRHYEPQRRVQSDDELLDKALDEQPLPTTPPKKTSLYDRMKFGPILTPSGGVGIGLGWEMN